MEGQTTGKAVKPRKPAEPKNFWQREAVNLIKSFIARQGLSAKALSGRFEDRLGIKIREGVLRNRINRGNFSFVFFVQCMHALGHQEVKLELASPPPKSKTKKAPAQDAKS